MNLKNSIKSIYEHLRLYRLRHFEIKKFKNIKRKKIYKKVSLSPKQKQEIDKLYLEHYGKKIPYVWHRHNLAFSGNFDKYFFPELLYIPEFEHYMNQDINANNFIEDKNNLQIFSNYLDILIPKTLLSCQCGVYMDSNNNIINESKVYELLESIGEVFYKPTIGTDSGKGCNIYNFKDGYEMNNNVLVKDLISNMGTDFIIQEKIVCHDSLKEIYSNSVNTFRIITYRWKNKIYHMPIIMRIGQNGSFLDNAHAGGIFIGLEDDGKFLKNAYTEFNTVYDKHPNTKYIFENHKIDLLPKVIDKCHKMHNKIRNIGVINWDMTINQNGEPLLIEVNVNYGSIWMSQFAHGRGAFGSNTEEVLDWLCFMNSLKYEDRKKFLYGKQAR